MEQLLLLWQLQETEQKIHRQEQAMQNLASVQAYQDKKKEFTLFQQELRAKEADINKDKKELRHKELALQTLSTSLQEMDKKLYSGEIRNIKELESLEKNVQARKKEISILEDEIIFIMEKLEQGAGEISQLKGGAEKKNEALQMLMFKARNAMHKAQGELGDLNKQREALVQEIDEGLLNKYRELAKRMPGGRCISLVKGGFCGICNVSLPSSFRGRMLTPGQLVFCENCGSLLVSGD